MCGSACALPLTHDVRHGLNGMCVSFSKARKAHTVWGLAHLLLRQEFCHCQLDPQQLVARLRDHAMDEPHGFRGFCESSACTCEFL